MTMAVMAEWVLGFDLDQAAHELDMWDQIGTVAMATNGDHAGGRWWAEAHSTDGCAWGLGLTAPDRWSGVVRDTHTYNILCNDIPYGTQAASSVTVCSNITDQTDLGRAEANSCPVS